MLATDCLGEWRPVRRRRPGAQGGRAGETGVGSETYLLTLQPAAK
jgi:hypothetical protein